MDLAVEHQLPSFELHDALRYPCGGEACLKHVTGEDSPFLQPLSGEVDHALAASAGGTQPLQSASDRRQLEIGSSRFNRDRVPDVVRGQLADLTALRAGPKLTSGDAVEERLRQP